MRRRPARPSGSSSRRGRAWRSTARPGARAGPRDARRRRRPADRAGSRRSFARPSSVDGRPATSVARSAARCAAGSSYSWTCDSQSNAVPGFLPSTHGLHFANRFPPGPTVRFGPIDPRWIGIGDAVGRPVRRDELVRPRAVRGRACPSRPIPRRRPTARRCSGLSSGARSCRSTGCGRRSASGGWARSGPDRARRQSRDVEWPQDPRRHRRRTPRDGRPRPRTRAATRSDLTQNHQVLAYAYEVDGDAVTLRLYDPNWPDRDDVTADDGAGATAAVDRRGCSAGIIRAAR